MVMSQLLVVKVNCACTTAGSASSNSKGSSFIVSLQSSLTKNARTDSHFLTVRRFLWSFPCTPESENFPPPRRRLRGDVVVMRAGNDLKIFGAGITIKQPLAGFRADDFVGSGNNHLHRAMITFQAVRRIETVEQKKIGRQERHLFLRDRRQIGIRSKQGETCDFRRMIFGEFTRHTRADGFAHDLSRQVGWQQLKRFFRGGDKILSARRTLSRTVAGIFQNENIHGRLVVNWPRQIIAAQGATGVAVDDQDATRRRTAGGNFPANDLASRIFPRSKAVFRRDGFNDGGQDFGGKINQAALKNQHRQNDEQVNDGEQLQHTKHPPPKSSLWF